MARKRKYSGFSLIELATTVALIGLVIGAGLSLATKESGASVQEETVASMDVIEEALKRFVKLNDRLPCPAIPDLAENDPDYGVEDDCSQAAASDTTIVEVNDGTADEVWIGNLPTRTLGLSDRYMLDGWNTRFTYVVPKAFATAGNDLKTLEGDDPAVMLEIQDKSGNRVSPANTENPVTYVLISHGQDKRGGYTRTGAVSVACSDSDAQQDAENCDHQDVVAEGRVFIDAELNNSTTPGEYFHDLVRWKTKVSAGALLAHESGDGSSTSGLVMASSVSTTWNNTFIISTDGKLYATGLENGEGALGNGGGWNDDTTTFEQIGTATDWVSIVHRHDWGARRCGLRADGKIYCWGWHDDFNRSGTALNTTSIVEAPNQTYSDWEKVAFGAVICGIRNGGELWCWGDGEYGKLGQGDQVDHATPVQVTAVTPTNGWSDVQSAERVTCGINTGRLYCWGRNTGNMLGLGLGPQGAMRLTPTQITSVAGDNWESLASSHYNMCGIKNGGELYCWGVNSWGQVGDGTTTTREAPVKVAFDDWSYVSISLGDGFTWEGRTTCGVRAGGLAYCWGRNDNGQMGTGSATPSQYNAPQQVATSITDWKEYQANHILSGCGVRQTGQYYCWGENRNGQFGDGTTSTSIVTPTEITITE